MSTLFKFVFALLAVGTVFVSCEKDETVQEVTEELVETEVLETIVLSQIPYVQMELSRVATGDVYEYVVEVNANLPTDSNPTLMGDGEIDDDVEYRAVTYSYEGTSTEYQEFSIQFTISPDELGLVEKGIYITVEPNESNTLKGLGNPGSVSEYLDNEII